jgi:hypothetical protein
MVRIDSIHGSPNKTQTPGQAKQGASLDAGLSLTAPAAQDPHAQELSKVTPASLLKINNTQIGETSMAVSLSA